MSQLENLLQQCTVKLTLPGHIGWGTGFFVAPGWILTCAHVVKEANGQPVKVRWQSQENWAEAVVERSLPDPYDLALLRITLPANTNPPCVYLDAAIQSRDPLYLFGYPDQDFPNGCPVTFNYEGFTGDEPALIKFALGQVRPGMSGAPLLNQRTGKVCGIVKFTRDRSFDLGGGAVPTTVILVQFPELLEQQRSFHQVDQRWLRQMEGAIASIPTNLPRSGVVEFVGRAESMLQLHEMLQQGDRVAVSAIAGMGGIGKTELALQYALAYKHLYAGGLCWLQARSSDVGTQLVRFVQSCLGLNPPDGLGLADQVRYCWRNWQAGEVLLIFDDVTDYGAIAPYLPPSTEPRFKVLITTRLRLGAAVNQLELGVLDEASALALLESLVGGDRLQTQLEDTKRLCNELGYLPLGLELVGRYLARKVDLSVADLRKRLAEKQLVAKALCQTDGDMTAKLGVAAAFQLSWETLSADAQQLGCGLSLFAATPIPWSLVEQCFSDYNPEELEDWRDSELLCLHLLQRVADSTYLLHPLIREFFQSQLAQSSNAIQLKQKFCQLMVATAEQIPDEPTHREIATIAPSIPHIIRAVTILKDCLSDENLTTLYTSLGDFYHGKGAYIEAEPWYAKCLSLSQENLGEDHPTVISSFDNLAFLYWEQGRYEEAKPLYLQALELKKRFLGEEHYDVAESFNNLALLYKAQEHYAEAEHLYLQTLALRKRLLGEEHPAIATSLNNLAALYNVQGRYEEAEPLFLQGLALCKRLLGEEHQDTANTLNNLAVLYRSQGRYTEAENFYLQTLKLAQQVFTEDHPKMGRCLTGLGKLQAMQGRTQEAEGSYIKALRILERQLGINHSWTIQCRENLEQLAKS